MPATGTTPRPPRWTRSSTVPWIWLASTRPRRRSAVDHLSGKQQGGHSRPAPPAPGLRRECQQTLALKGLLDDLPHVPRQLGGGQHGLQLPPDGLLQLGFETPPVLQRTGGAGGDLGVLGVEGDDLLGPERIAGAVRAVEFARVGAEEGA